MGFPGDSVVKSPPAYPVDARDACLILGTGRSPGERIGNSIKNSMDWEAWRAAVHDVTKI